MAGRERHRRLKHEYTSTADVIRVNRITVDRWVQDRRDYNCSVCSKVFCTRVGRDKHLTDVHRIAESRKSHSGAHLCDAYDETFVPRLRSVRRSMVQKRHRSRPPERLSSAKKSLVGPTLCTNSASGQEAFRLTVNETSNKRMKH